MTKYDPKNPNPQVNAGQGSVNMEDELAGDEEIGNLRTLLRTI